MAECSFKKEVVYKSPRAIPTLVPTITIKLAKNATSAPLK